MTYSGQCSCGAIRYELSGEPNVVALCHCRDCRRSSGAPMVAWAMFPEAALTVTKGQPKTINSSGTAMRSFCADCGSGLFYRNAAALPGIVDVQSATLDDPDALAPAMQIQTAERLAWMKHAHALPEFERFPAQGFVAARVGRRRPYRFTAAAQRLTLVAVGADGRGILSR